MKAAVVPAVNSNWEIQELPTPEPSVNQVLIEIRASGLCYTDVHITKGAIPTEFPRTLEHEPVGEIVAIGEGVTTRKVGDRCEWCLRGKRMFCAQQIGTGVQMQG